MVVTTYGVLRSDVKKFQKLPLRLMVINEAQNIISLIFRVVRSLKAESMSAMSGAPVENRLLEYRSIMDFTNPGLPDLLKHSRRSLHFRLRKQNS